MHIFISTKEHPEELQRYLRNDVIIKKHPIFRHRYALFRATDSIKPPKRRESAMEKVIAIILALITVLFFTFYTIRAFAYQPEQPLFLTQNIGEQITQELQSANFTEEQREELKNCKTDTECEEMWENFQKTNQK
jgi:hypothetical protein